jgi:hypothetical protein
LVPISGRPFGVGQIEQRPLDAPFVVLAVALQLEIEPAVEQPGQPVELVLRRRSLSRAQQRPERARGLPAQRQQTRRYGRSSSSIGRAAFEAS